MAAPGKRDRGRQARHHRGRRRPQCGVMAHAILRGGGIPSTSRMALHGGQGFEGDALMPEDSRGNNRRAVLDYERTAREYVATVEGRASATAEALRRLAAEVAPGTRGLEGGAGPGWGGDGGG